jgi:voltage-gated potassium channel
VSNNRGPWILLAATIGIIIVGTEGFMQLEGLSFNDSLYQTLLVLLRHYGYIEVHHTAARVLNIVLILCSLGIIGLLLKWCAEYMIGVGDNVRKRRLHAKVKKMKQHYIICGLGRVGSQVAREMALENVEFVAMDRDQNKVGEAVAAGYVAFVADSADEESLKQAGIDHAAGLVASLGDDSANLLVTLAARAINPHLYIVSRANRAENEVKLKRAGADRVALPYQIGGYHMASMALRPSVVDYMVVVGENSRLAGHRLGRALAQGEIGATVIAINGSDGTSRVRPTGQEVIYPGDRLIVLGAKPDLTKASALVR